MVGWADEEGKLYERKMGKPERIRLEKKSRG
jgi:hypothetical protein